VSVILIQIFSLIQKLLQYPMPNVSACSIIASAVQHLQAAGCGDDSVISSLFERAAALAGSENDSLWLQWAKHELQCGNAKAASRVHWSAVRALSEVIFSSILFFFNCGSHSCLQPDDFVASYNQLLQDLM
jgi:hypothetical protein